MRRSYSLLEKDTQCVGRNRVRRTQMSEKGEERNKTTNNQLFKEKTGQKIRFLVNI